MPSILPILSYDVPIHQDGAGSDLEKSSTLVFKGELHSPNPLGSGSSGSLLKKHPSATQELHDNKKKAHLETSDGAQKNLSISDSVKLMKKAVFAVQTTLYNGLKSPAQLQAATRLLTQAEYSDVVTERSNDKQCGYPLCLNPLNIEKKARKGRYHISLSQHKVYDLEEMRLFCSSGCGVTSKSYGAGLRVSHEGILDQETLEDIVASVRGLSLEKTSELPPVGESLVVHEKHGGSVDEFSGSPGEIEGYTPKSYVGSDGKPLKSAMKNSPRKHQRITWADEAQPGGDAGGDEAQPEEDSFSFMVDRQGFDEELVEGGVKERLGIAHTIAQALSQAASASSFGEVEAFEAAANAGLAIVPPGEEQVRCEQTEGAADAVKGDLEGAPVVADGQDTEPDDEEEEDLDDLDESSDGEEDLDENDSPETKDLYDDPPEGFRAELSAFGSIWTALDGWVSSETLAYIYARESSIEEFRSVNGRSIADVDGSSCGEILRTMSENVSRVLPEVVQALGVSVPISVIEQAVGRLLGTMNFVHAVPAFSTKNWRVIITLFLDVLSVRMGALDASLSKNRALLEEFVLECGTSDADYEIFKELLLPLGRLSNASGA